MRIGFELPGYTYTEPQFETTIDFYVSPTGQPENGPIYLVKKDNMLSEQNFHITIQVMDSAPHGSSFHPATFGVDYRLSRKHFTQLFHTFQQRLPFYFTLLIDDIAEGTEAFQACVSLEDNFQPNLTSSIYIIIKDNDGIFSSNYYDVCYSYTLLFLIVITIGFINGSYAVGETAGMIQVLVYVFNPPENLVSPTLIIDLVIQTVSGSASKYTGLASVSH